MSSQATSTSTTKGWACLFCLGPARLHSIECFFFFVTPHARSRFLDPVFPHLYSPAHSFSGSSSSIFFPLSSLFFSCVYVWFFPSRTTFVFTRLFLSFFVFFYRGTLSFLRESIADDIFPLDDIYFICESSLSYYFGFLGSSAAVFFYLNFFFSSPATRHKFKLLYRVYRS